MSDDSNESFARRMARRRARAKFPELPDDIIPCNLCVGGGVNGGITCAKCKGFGFHKLDGSIAEIHSARGGFYMFAALDAVIENLLGIKLSYAGPQEPKGLGYKGKDRCTFHFEAGRELVHMIVESESKRFASRAAVDVAGAIELWMMPTPAPAKSRMLLGVADGGNLTAVHHEDGGLAYPVFSYRALDHYAAMQNLSIDKAERMARVVHGDFVNHPGHGDVPTAEPRPILASVDIPSVVMGQPPERQSYNLRKREDGVALGKIAGRLTSAAAIQFELRPEMGRDIWCYQPHVEILTL